MKQNLTKPIDDVLVAAGVLKRLKAFNISTLKDRIKAQKCQYLAQVFSVSPGYSYNLYIRGPYSPDLAKDLFSIKGFKVQPIRFSIDELEERFSSLDEFIKSKTVRQLELLVTYHWLRSEAGLDKKEALARLQSLKCPDKQEKEFVLRESARLSS